MAIKITEECINCGACEPECPNNAIYEGGVEWALTDGTSVKGSFKLLDGTILDAAQRNAPISVDTYYIVPNKCTECQGFHEEPQCAAVCPVDCCVPDEMYKETVDELLAAAAKLDVPAHAAPHLPGALAQAWAITPPEGIIVATGSVFLVGELRALALGGE